MRAERAEGRRAGFSLIELLLVVVILLVLTVLYWGSTSTKRQQSLQTQCRGNLQKVYLALEIYSREHAGKFPAVPSAATAEQPLDLLVPKYTADTSLFICPGSGDSPLPSGEPLVKHRISYAYYMGRSATDAQLPLMSDRQVSAVSRSANQPIFSTNGKPPGNNHEKGGNFLFCDGRVEAAPCVPPFAAGVTQGVVFLNPK